MWLSFAIGYIFIAMSNIIASSILETIGHTPLVRLENIEREYGLPYSLYAKLERFNPTGSIKDRTAYYLIKEAKRKLDLPEGGLVIEPTSGNTGIGLAMVCAVLGHPLHIYMPSSASKERIQMMEAYGAKVILTPGQEGMKGAVEAAKKELASTPGSFLAGQFDNPDNALAHYETTGPEIVEQLDGKIDALIASIGTGGTITGIARYFKEKAILAKIIGVEPTESPLLTKGYAGPHLIQGIGANFIPKVLDRSLLDEVIDIASADAYEGTRILAKKEGILAGISSGSALMAALKSDLKGNVVVILPDNGERYLSVKGLYE